MFKKLEILNGELSVKFDPLNTRYTVKMSTNEEELKINYEIEDDDNISIFNNNITEDDTQVVITVYNDEEMTSYYLEVYKDKNEEANASEDYFKSLEIKSDTYTSEYVAPLIAGVCFVLILFLFTALFKKRKKCK